jgi:hypothetical protein
MGKMMEVQKQQRQQQEQFDFKPQLNSNSTQIAMKYRQKVAD